jgi:methylglutaconyl-CoA hydratase
MTTSAASTADPGRVTSEIRDGVATIGFHHPKGNSLPAALLRNLAAEVTALGRTPSARVIVLRSEGTGPFCAGASFDELRSIGDPEAGREFFMGFARLILAMRDAPKFVLARIQGRTVGGGVGVAAAADYAVALDSASVRLSELAVGIGPFVVGPVIEKKIGLAAFQALAVDASEWRDAAWAARVGLFARVVPSIAELDSVVDALARRLAASNPEAMERMKAIFWEGTEHWERLLADRAQMSGTLVLSDFTRNAIAAFAAR